MIKIFNNNKEYSQAERMRVGRNAGIAGIAVNLLLFVIKLIAGIASASVSITADAVNNLSDAGSSIILMVSYILSGKPADKNIRTAMREWNIYPRFLFLSL